MDIVTVDEIVAKSYSFLDISPTVFAIDHADVTVVIGSMSRILPLKSALLSPLSLSRRESSVVACVVGDELPLVDRQAA